MMADGPRPEQAWQAVLNLMQQELPRPAFEERLVDAHLLAYADGEFTIGVGDDFTRSWLESRLASTLARGLTGILNRPAVVRFVLGTEAPRDERISDRDPEQAWRSVLAQLARSPMAAALWEDLQAAHFLAYYDGRFLIGLPDVGACEQLQRDLGAELAHRLGALLANPPLQVQFVAAPGLKVDEAPSSPETEGGDGTLPPEGQGLTAASAEILIQPIRTSLYEILARPKSVVVVPAYLLRWLPYLGVDQGWFLVAMRQAFYQAHGEKMGDQNCGRTFTVSRQQIARWSSLGDQKVWGYLKRLEKKRQAGNFLAWFLQATPRGRGRPRVYAFRADMPLTPGDVEALHAWLLANGIRDHPLETLQAALEKQPGEILPYPPGPPAEHHRQLAPDPRSVQEVVLAAAGLGRPDPDYLAVKKLADDLQRHLQSPSDNLLIPHYFLLEWVHRLGRIPAWIITILRDRGYIDHATGVRRDRIRLSGGYGELARLLAISERQIESWLPPLQEMVRHQPPRDPDSHWARHQAKRELVGRFLEKEGQVDWSGAGDTRYEFRVRLEDPLTPEQQEIHAELESLLHESLLAGDPSPLASLATEIEQYLIRVSHNASEVWSADDTGYDVADARFTHLADALVRDPHNPGYAIHTGNDAVGARFAQLKALLFKHLNPKALSAIKQLLQQYLDDLFEAGPETALDISEGGGVANELVWDWQALLGYGGLSSGERTAVLDSAQNRRQFLGQVLYGYEQRAGEDGQGIQAPFRFAARRWHDCPPPEYMELASLPPGQLAAVLQDALRQGQARVVSDSAYRLARALREHDFLPVIESAARPRAGR